MTAPFVVDVLAAYRLTRLLVEDRVTKTPREALQARNPTFDYMLGCWWCSGLWCAVGVVAMRRKAPRVWQPVAEVLAISTIVGLISDY